MVPLRMEPQQEALFSAYEALVERNRLRCLWFMKPGYLPRDTAGMLRVLRAIEKAGDLETYVAARRLIQCLSPLSN